LIEFAKGLAVSEQGLDPLFDDDLELREHLGLGPAVATLADHGRGAADIAAILVAPLDDFQIPSGCTSDLSGWSPSTALRTDPTDGLL
jgi:hypothetical protein